MRFLIQITLISSLLVICFCRPPNINERDDSEETEAEYKGDDESSVDDSLRDNADYLLSNRQESADDQEESLNRQVNYDSKKFMQRNSEGRSARNNVDRFSEYKSESEKNSEEHTEDSDKSNNDYEVVSKRRQSDTYIENNDANEQAEISRHLTNPDVNNLKLNRVPIELRHNDFIKRTITHQATTGDEGESLFGNIDRDSRNRLYNADKTEYDKDAVADEQSHYYKDYDHDNQAENRAKLVGKNYENSNFNFNRRQVRDADGKNSQGIVNSNNEENIGDNVNEDEESAIKRHIKKMSGEELEELLNSLSDDKKALLNKIMDNDHNSDNINKREITKKAGAVEENNFMENSISDSNKVQGASPSAEVDKNSAVSPSSDVKENSKPVDMQTEISEMSTSKSETHPDSTDNKAELKNCNSEGIGEKSDLNLNDVTSDANNKNLVNIESDGSTKTDNKRETNPGDLMNMKVNLDDTKLLDSEFNMKGPHDISDDGSFCGQDEFSQFIDDETEPREDKAHNNKREALYDNQVDFADSFKYLEESFPNSEICKETRQYSESDMMPLIRVKRKNNQLSVKKRAAAVLPDAKMAYFPYRAESDDEDSEEGNEFEDNVYDGASNIANIDPEVTANKINFEIKLNQPENDNINGDAMSLGSDTDSVLSGVEGVDDNLMFSSGLRNKRTVDDKPTHGALMKMDPSIRSTSINSEMKLDSDSLINIPNYQESEAFGALPRSYDGDVARFKRVRRVNHSPPHSSDASGSINTT